MEIQIVPATLYHAELLAPNLRQSDADEVMASGGNDPLGALTKSVKLSDPDYCWTALLDGFPEIMWGAAPYPTIPSVGIVWLLSSDAMYEIKGRFMRESVRHVARMHERFDTLMNYVDARNVKSQEWLTRLGFHKVSVDENYGYERRPFILFAREKHV